jgi:hypothetical protein
MARRRSRGRLLVLVVLAYACVLLASPLLHHDFDCHLKSPTHCNACLASPAACRGESAGVLAHPSLLRGEGMDRTGAPPSHPPSIAPLPGRSPPA